MKATSAGLAAPTALVALSALVAIAAASSACSSCGAKTNPGADAVSSVEGLTPEQAAQVLARVGDHTITLGDYVKAVEHMDQFDRMRYQSPERRRELLQEMIDVELLADEAHDKGWDKDPLTEQEIREVLRDAMLKRAAAGAPAPNDIPADEVRAYYEAHKADFKDPERRRVSAIVLSNAAAAAQALEAAKKATAGQWGELVRAKSVDSQAKANVPVDLAGDLGFVSPPGDPRGANSRVPEAVRIGVFEIADKGGVLGRVVPVDDKFYVVRLESKTDPHERSLEEAERPIRVKLAQEKMRAKEDAMLADLRTQFPVQIDEAALAQVKVDTGADGGAR
jgi:peptidyl-prolyl cis-trans isomerase C